MVEANPDEKALSPGLFGEIPTRAKKADIISVSAASRNLRQLQLEQSKLLIRRNQNFNKSQMNREGSYPTMAASQQEVLQANMDNPPLNGHKVTAVLSVKSPMNSDTATAATGAGEIKQSEQSNTKALTVEDGVEDTALNSKTEDLDNPLPERTQSPASINDTSEATKPGTAEKENLEPTSKPATKQRKTPAKEKPVKKESVDAETSKESANSQPINNEAINDDSPVKKVGGKKEPAEKKPRAAPKKRVKAERAASPSGEPSSAGRTKKTPAASRSVTRKAPAAIPSAGGRKKRATPASATTPDSAPKRLKVEIAEKEAIISKRKEELTKKREARLEAEKNSADVRRCDWTILLPFDYGGYS